MIRHAPAAVHVAGNASTFDATKVPAATALFWLIKIVGTGTGETASDYLVTALDPVPVVAVAGVVTVVCLAIQLSARRYVPWRYWLLVTVFAVFGTMVADVAHVIVGIPYEISTAIFAVVLALVFVLWWRVERTVSIHEITTPRRELFYWAAVGSTFALGTAAGDLTAHSFGLGYLVSGVLFTVVIAMPFVAFRADLLGAVPAFWAAYVVTRPLGASFADWLAVDVARGGLAYGADRVSLAGALLIAVLVLASSRRRRPASISPTS